MDDINPYSEEGRRLMGEKGLMYDPVKQCLIPKFRYCEVMIHLKDDDRTMKGLCRRFDSAGEASDFADMLMTTDQRFILWETTSIDAHPVREYIRTDQIVGVRVSFGVRE